MEKESLYFYQTQESAYNAIDFLESLDLLFQHLGQDRYEKVCCIMDNVRFHKVDDVIAKFDSHGHDLVFLPPCSPSLNPTENLFNQLKHYYKLLQPKNPDEVFASIERASEVISSADCASYFLFLISKYLPMCLQKIHINN